jgi:nucleotide-binding universal stress UspA family protein
MSARPRAATAGKPSASHLPGSVVVGFNGTQLSCEALEWAAREAVRRRSDLEIVTVWDPYPAAEWSSVVEEWRADICDQVQGAIRSANARTAGRVPVRGTVLEGDPARALLDEAADAALLVIGSTGHVGFLGAVAGSTSRRCARDAGCPVVIVGPDVVATTVTGYLTSVVLDTRGDATRWLAAERASRPLPVTVVEAWDVSPTMRQGRPGDGLRVAGHAGDLVVVPRSALHDVGFHHQTRPVLIVPDA